MSAFIREESGVRFIKKQGFFLFDTEPLLQKFMPSCWRTLKVPEFVLWNEKEILIVEAKSSIPKKQPKKLDSQVEACVNQCGYKLVSRFDNYCAELRDKFVTALTLLRPDIVGRVVDSVSEAGKQCVEVPELLRKCRPIKVDNIRLLLILKDIPDQYIDQISHELRNKILTKIKAWQPNCDIFVLSEKNAIKLGIAIL